MHNSYTAQQKKQLCEPPESVAASASLIRRESGSSIGPAICASVAKDALHAKFDVVLALCKGASSAAPAQCMSKLDNMAKNKYGTRAVYWSHFKLAQ